MVSSFPRVSWSPRAEGDLRQLVVVVCLIPWVRWLEDLVRWSPLLFWLRQADFWLPSLSSTLLFQCVESMVRRSLESLSLMCFVTDPPTLSVLGIMLFDVYRVLYSLLIWNFYYEINMNFTVNMKQAPQSSPHLFWIIADILTDGWVNEWVWLPCE